ncbi:MAG: EAL domain-containing protein [Nitrospirae bacterium]|nr:EAL domain-containing protein [Nitrospirota bacterium]
MKLHSLLNRQLKRFFNGIESVPKGCGELIEAVNSAYSQFDIDREMLERSLELSSQELIQANSDIRALFERIINSSGDGIFAFDHECHCTVWNPGMEAITGIGKDEASNRLIYDLLHPFQEIAGPRIFSDIIEGKTTVTIEKSFTISRDGRKRHYEAQFSPLYNESRQAIGGFAIIRDVTSRMQAEEMIKYQAYHDSLTGLPNRLLFEDRLSMAISQARRTEAMLAILFIDLDRFKVINDTLGHNIGDQLLKVLGERLTHCMRDGDTVARMGGDEFTVLLPVIESKYDAIRAAERIFNVLRPVFNLENHELYISGSIGIAIYPECGDDPQTLLKNADIALYQVKDQGGDNNSQVYSSTMDHSSVERLSLESALRQAITRDELILNYQPTFHLLTGALTGMEALVRWNRPHVGTVSPGAFIPIAEESGLILPIGKWVLNAACQQLKSWQATGVEPLSVAVNLSARQIHQGDLLEEVTRVLNTTGLSPRYLELELTESLLMKNTDAIIRLLHQLSDMGIQLSIDDFGTGYSSLSYLKRFPIHKLKIDQSFVRNITTDTNDAVIAQTIIRMAHSLGLRAVAEGVETLDQLNLLRSLECDEAQGFYFSKPLPHEEFKNLLTHKWNGVKT